MMGQELIGRWDSIRANHRRMMGQGLIGHWLPPCYRPHDDDDDDEDDEEDDDDEDV